MYEISGVADTSSSYEYEIVLPDGHNIKHKAGNFDYRFTVDEGQFVYISQAIAASHLTELLIKRLC